jgi:hypothetical protein
MSQKVSEITAKICSQNSIADASFSAWPWRLATAPASMEVGIDCCRRSTNWNILLLGGRNPNLSAVRTTAIPTGGNKNSLVNVIAIVDRMPNCELPGPPTKLPPKTNIIQGTIAPPNKLRLSKKKKKTECSSNMRFLKNGTEPITNAKNEATTGGWKTCCRFD